jgi:hypothetical protein
MIWFPIHASYINYYYYIILYYLATVLAYPHIIHCIFKLPFQALEKDVECWL